MVKDYHVLLPEAPYDAYVARVMHVHFMAPVRPERLAPDGYIKLSIILSGVPLYHTEDGTSLPWGIGFAGHMFPERARYLSSAGPVHVVGLNFIPSGFYRLFGKAVNAFNEHFMAPEPLLAGRYEHLRKALEEETDPAQRCAIAMVPFAEMIDRALGEGETAMQRVERHIRATHGQATTPELAEIAGLSIRQLERRSVIELGANPKTFSSIIRFNYAYQRMKELRKLDLDIALQCGYYDESHMLRDLAYYLGGRSKQYVDLVRPVVDMNLGH